jgi:hypothetical protein
LLSARFAHAEFQRRVQQTLQPDEEEIDDLLEEKKREEMSKSLVSRTVGRLSIKWDSVFRSSAKDASGAQIRDMLEQAGHPMGMHYPEFLGLKMFCLLALTGIGFFVQLHGRASVLGWRLYLPIPLPI